MNPQRIFIVSGTAIVSAFLLNGCDDDSRNGGSGSKTVLLATDGLENGSMFVADNTAVPVTMTNTSVPAVDPTGTPTDF